VSDPLLPIAIALAGGGQVGNGTFLGTLGGGADVVLRTQSPMESGGVVGVGMRANLSMLGDLQGELSAGGELSLGLLPGIPTLQFGGALQVRGTELVGDSYIGWTNVAQGAVFQYRYYGMPLSGRTFSLDILGMAPLEDVPNWGVYFRANQTFQGNTATRMMLGVMWCPGGLQTVERPIP
jgi:hypothetical protein